eukprot:234511_1
MGKTCSNDDDTVYEPVDDEKSIRPEKKHFYDESGDGGTNNTAKEMEAMAKEVILLSTRNANLEQELDESNKKITRLKEEIDSLIYNNNLSIDILNLCKILNINYMNDIHSSNAG